MMKLKLIIFTLILSSFAVAQHSEQPEAESNTDLRGQLTLFSIETPDHDMVILERSSNYDYFFLSGEKKDQTKTKIDAKEAQSIDREFTSLFIKSMYELPAYEGKCKQSWDLKMKGDSLKVCEEDEQRHQLFENFLKPLRKKHSF